MDGNFERTGFIVRKFQAVSRILLRRIHYDICLSLLAYPVLKCTVCFRPLHAAKPSWPALLKAIPAVLQQAAYSAFILLE